MRRVIVLDKPDAIQALIRMHKTFNDRPIFGRRAGELFLEGFEWDVFHMTQGYPGMIKTAFRVTVNVTEARPTYCWKYGSTDWSLIEKAEVVSEPSIHGTPA